MDFLQNAHKHNWLCFRMLSTLTFPFTKTVHSHKYGTFSHSLNPDADRLQRLLDFMQVLCDFLTLRGPASFSPTFVPVRISPGFCSPCPFLLKLTQLCVFGGNLLLKPNNHRPPAPLTKGPYFELDFRAAPMHGRLSHVGSLDELAQEVLFPAI